LLEIQRTGIDKKLPCRPVQEYVAILNVKNDQAVDKRSLLIKSS
jgi:hypothetical protein